MCLYLLFLEVIRSASYTETMQQMIKEEKMELEPEEEIDSYDFLLEELSDDDLINVEWQDAILELANEGYVESVLFGDDWKKKHEK